MPSSAGLGATFLQERRLANHPGDESETAVRAGNDAIPRGVDALMATRPVVPVPVPHGPSRCPRVGEPVSREPACRL